MLILDGKLVAQQRRDSLKTEIAAFSKQWGRTPQLTVLLVGENPASQVYVTNKVKACAEVGLLSELIRLPSSTNQAELLARLKSLNQDPAVDGILVQLPLPLGISEHQVNENILPNKDADIFSAQNLGALWSGQSKLAPCTPKGVMTLLAHYGIKLAGLKAVVIGRSNIVGKPMAHLLTQADATVTLCHSKTKNLKEYTSAADLVVVAAGQPRFLGREDFKKDSIVVDVGIHKVDGKICGDVRFEELQGWCQAATPVPGGVGPMTIVTLLENTLALAKLSVGPK